MVVTIEGLAASGKGILSKNFAQEHGFYYLDIGLVFRLVAHAKISGVLSRPRTLFRDLESAEAWYVWDGICAQCGLFNKNLTSLLRSSEITKETSDLSMDRNWLEAMLDYSLSLVFGQSKIISDGRNASHLFPAADFKFFLEASLQERARRRFQDLKKLEDGIQFAVVYAQMEERDRKDMERSFLPLSKSKEGVYVLDTERNNVRECLQIMSDVVFKK